MHFLPTQLYWGSAGDSQHFPNTLWEKVTPGTASRTPVWQDCSAFMDEGYILVHQDHLRFYSMSYMLEVNKKADFEGQVSDCKSFSHTNPRWFNWNSACCYTISRHIEQQSGFFRTLFALCCFIYISLQFLAAIWAHVKILKSPTALVINSPRTK